MLAPAGCAGVGAIAQRTANALLPVSPVGAGRQLLLRSPPPQLPADPFCGGVPHTSRPRRPSERTSTKHVFVAPTHFARLQADDYPQVSSELARYGPLQATRFPNIMDG